MALATAILGFMTLHVAFVSEASIVQCSDRLLTVNTDPWDATSNKTIVVEARNGRAVLGYAGLAHIRGEPTSEWLVRKITAAKEPFTSFQFGGVSPVWLGDVRDRVIGGVEREFPSSQRVGRRQRLELMICGWGYPRRLRNSKRPTAFIWQLTHSGVQGARCKIRPTTRLRFRDPSRRWAIAGIGRADLLNCEAINQELLAESDPFGRDEVERSLVGAIRSVADLPGSRVGSDVMSVCLPALPPESPASFRFFRDTGVIDDRLGYTPALVSSRSVFPPAVMNSSQGFSAVFNADTPFEWEYTTETIPPWTQTGVRTLSVQMGKRYDP